MIKSEGSNDQFLALNNMNCQCFWTAEYLITCLFKSKQLLCECSYLFSITVSVQTCEVAQMAVRSAVLFMHIHIFSNKSILCEEFYHSQRGKINLQRSSGSNNKVIISHLCILLDTWCILIPPLKPWKRKSNPIICLSWFWYDGLKRIKILCVLNTWLISGSCSAHGPSSNL